MATTEKTCRICGCDCSNRPRTKDRKGRYYCRVCYDAAIAKKRKREAEAAAAAPSPAASAGGIEVMAGPIVVDRPTPDPETPPSPPEPAPLVGGADEPTEYTDEPALDFTGLGHDTDISMLSHIMDDTESGGAHAPPPAAEDSVCPDCQNAVPFGTIICVNCGYNFQTHSHVSPAVARAGGFQPIVEGGVRQTVWPYVVGIISILFATLEGGWFVLSMIGAMLGGEGETGIAVTQTIVMFVFLLMAAWLLMAGIGILRRRQAAVPSIKRWAWFKIALGLLCVGLPTIVLMVIGSKVDLEQAGVPAEFMGILVGIMLAVLGWYVAWPIFCLVWFKRLAIEQEVGRWR